MEFLIRGLGLAHPWPLWTFESESVWKISFVLSLSLSTSFCCSAFQIDEDKQFFKRKTMLHLTCFGLHLFFSVVQGLMLILGYMVQK